MNWYKKIKKLSFRGNTPRAFDLDERLQDPYKKQEKDILVTPGTEELSGGFGTRFRGLDSPIDFSSRSRDTYEKQTHNDIPTREHVMNEPPSEGIPPGELADPQDVISRNYRIMDKLDNPYQEPKGPHNMNQDKVIFGPRNNVFEKVRIKQRR